MLKLLHAIIQKIRTHNKPSVDHHQQIFVLSQTNDRHSFFFSVGDYYFMDGWIKNTFVGYKWAFHLGKLQTICQNIEHKRGGSMNLLTKNTWETSSVRKKSILINFWFHFMISASHKTKDMHSFKLNDVTQAYNFINHNLPFLI